MAAGRGGRGGPFQSTAGPSPRGRDGFGRPGPAKVALVHLHPPGETSASFEKSKLGLILAELDRLTDEDGNLLYIAQMAAAGRLAEARNEVVRRFLTTSAEWLLFIDSDMGFEDDLLARLLEAADPDERPVVGGLAFASRFDGWTEGHGCAIQWQPTLYQRQELPDGQVSYEPAFDYPRDAVVQVDGTGAAVLLIHRTVLEVLGADWFTPYALGTNEGVAGEDISLCERLHTAGIPVHVNTGAKTNHHKDVWYSEDDYLDQRHPAATAVTVVIPVADDVTAARTLVGALHAQGGYSDVLIYNTGTDPAMREWLEAQGVADVFEAPDDLPTIYNTAIDEAVRRHHGHAAVVLLSPDVKVGPMYLRRLLRDGAATDALVLTAAQIAAGYRFPTEAVV